MLRYPKRHNSAAQFPLALASSQTHRQVATIAYRFTKSANLADLSYTHSYLPADPSSSKGSPNKYFDQYTTGSKMRLITTWTVMLSMIFSSTISCAVDPTPIPANPDQVTLSNVELSSSGALLGQYLSTSGQPIANATILVQSGKTAQSIQTNSEGRFEISRIESGQCTFQIDESMYACRVWANGTAPPKSLDSIAIVSEEDSVLGNHWNQRPVHFPRGRLSALSSGQKAVLGICAIAGTGIAIAVSQNNKDNAS